MKIRQILLLITLCIISFIFIAPFIWVLLTSFKPTQEIYKVPLTLLPERVILTHYKETLSKMCDFPIFYKNSIVVTASSLALTLFIGLLAGFGFGRFRFKFNTLFLAFFLFIITLPWGMFLIPIYILEDSWGLLNSHLALILPYTALNLPLTILILTAAFRNVPSEIEDAARIDGCNNFQIWYRIALPLIKPNLAAAAILSFVLIWGEFIFAVTLNTHSTSLTIPVGIVLLQGEGQSYAYGTLTTAIVLTLIIPLMIFLLFQRQLIKGVREGALVG